MPNLPRAMTSAQRSAAHAGQKSAPTQTTAGSPLIDSGGWSFKTEGADRSGEEGSPTESNAVAGTVVTSCTSAVEASWTTVGP